MAFPHFSRLIPWFAALPMATAGLPTAAAADAAVAPAQQYAELDEVLVRGERLEHTIVDAEDAFYRLYNQLNRDDRYDVNCAYVNVDSGNPGSRIGRRVCMPGFLADAVVDWTVFKMTCQPPQEGFDEFDCLDQNNDHRLSRMEVAVRPDLWDMMATTGYIARSDWTAFSVTSTTLRGPAPYQPPPPTLVLMEGTKAWYEHMLRTIQGDPRLLEMAGRLDDLHREYLTLQQQEADWRALEYAERAQRRGKFNGGPRAR